MLFFRIFFCLFIFLSLFQFIKDSQDTSWDLIMQIEASEKINSGIEVYHAERDWVKATRYPPWILFILKPLSNIDKQQLLFIFSLVQIFSYLGLLYFLKNKLTSIYGPDKTDLTLFALYLFYFEIFRETVISGNFVFVIFLISFFFLLFEDKNKMTRFFSPVIAIFFLSTKIFTLLPILQSFRLNKTQIVNTTKVVFSFAFLCLILTGLLASSYKDQGSIDLLRSWIIENQKLNQVISPYILRGPLNPSISTAIVTSFDIVNWPMYYDLIFSICSFLVLVCIYVIKSKNKPNRSFNLLWLFALVPLLHPTPWKHLYIFSFPLIALVLFSFNKFHIIEKMLISMITLRFAFGSNRIMYASDQFTNLDYYVPWGYCYFGLMIWITLNYNKLCQFYDEILLQRKNFGSSF